MTSPHDANPENVEYLRQIIVNDGRGDQCGRGYAARLACARQPRSISAVPKEWLHMATQAASWCAKHDDDRKFTALDILAAALAVAEYYAQHIAEGA